MTPQDALVVLQQKNFYTKTRREYHTAIEALQNPGRKISCGKNTGSGRHSSSVSWKKEVVSLFKRIGLDEDFYIFGNDAPRYGKHGDFVLIFNNIKDETTDKI